MRNNNNNSPKAESEITTVGGERVPLGGCSRRWRRACKGSPPRANGAVASGVRTPREQVHHEVYIRRRPLFLRSVVHTNIPLSLPLRNVIRKSSIHRRSTVASVPLVPAKAREGAGAWLLLRRCTVAAVVPLVPAKAREGAGGWLLRRRCTVAAVVPLVPDKAREGA